MQQFRRVKDSGIETPLQFLEVERSKDEFFTDVVPTRELAICFHVKAVAHDATVHGFMSLKAPTLMPEMGGAGPLFWLRARRQGITSALMRS